MNLKTAFWNSPTAELISYFNSNINGITDAEAAERKKSFSVKKIRSPFVIDMLALAKQFYNPLSLILIFAVILSSALSEFSNAFIILGIILLSGLLGFWQERNAGRAVQKLRAMVQVKVTVKRNGIAKEVPIDEIVPGDIVLLNAGNIIPGDSMIIESKDLHVNESPLTGESFPAEKEVGIIAADAPLSKRKNAVFKGTNVVNGTATVLVISIGEDTELGKISAELEKQFPENTFELGIRKFGYMLMQITLVLSILIILINIYFGKPITESILFALALAVGLTPELLPAIVTITLSAGAQRLAKEKVIVKKLASMQNLGAVDVFCSDKTGTLTEGVIKVDSTVDAEGNNNEKIKKYAYLNASFETGFNNPLDDAIRGIEGINIDEYKKVDEVPYDFIRKRLSIVVENENHHLMISKGALNNILEVCQTVEIADGKTFSMEEYKEKINKKYEEYSSQGFRTIGICFKDVTNDPVINKDDESNMTFLGFILLSDPPKQGIIETVKQLKDAGITLKIITGDNKLVATHIGTTIGLDCSSLITGSELRLMSEEALIQRVRYATIFAEIEPNQKERLVRALQKGGSTVGYIGDGINDVSAIKAADVGISVDTAVDVAKETADIVFLEKDLKVLYAGINEGRITYMNTMKYIFIATSANLGNMFSVACASIILPFLPLLPKQILLTNFMSDLPAMAISSDNVDKEFLLRPKKWDTKLIRNFMFVFGLQSSLFDFLTFFVLLKIFHTNPAHFRTGWFIESVVTEILILLIIRTQRPFFKSKPGKYLVMASLFVIVVTFILPYSPLSGLLDFDPLSYKIIAGMTAVTLLYCLCAEITKKMFFKKVKFQ